MNQPHTLARTMTAQMMMVNDPVVVTVAIMIFFLDLVTVVLADLEEEF